MFPITTTPPWSRLTAATRQPRQTCHCSECSGYEERIATECLPSPSREPGNESFALPGHFQSRYVTTELWISVPACQNRRVGEVGRMSHEGV